MCNSRSAARGVEHSRGTAASIDRGWRKEGMTASPYGPQALGCTHATVARTIGYPARGR